MNKWQSTEKSLPTWEDGEVLIMLSDSRIVKARYDEYKKVWGKKEEGRWYKIIKEKVRYWKPILQPSKSEP